MTKNILLVCFMVILTGLLLGCSCDCDDESKQRTKNSSSIERPPRVKRNSIVFSEEDRKRFGQASYNGDKKTMGEIYKKYGLRADGRNQDGSRPAPIIGNGARF
ncbi:MAG: hypothetical protein HRT90_00615 [Candidatus Margulisbacteria bacterium]|nr:hypothetical protein [Candidatus Margulisiibacteriota bacterium]